MHSFDNIKTGTTTPWQEQFTEEYNDDGQLTLLSKEMFHHEEPGLIFDYRYVITALDMQAAVGEGNTIGIELYLVPEPKDWCEASLRKAAVSYGWEKESRESILQRMRPQDAIENGYAVLVGRDTVTYDPAVYEDGFYNVLDNKDVAEKINTAASIVAFYDATRGFVLDSFQNRVGTTGWDVLEDCLHGKDMIQTGLNRLAKQREAKEEK